MRPAPACTVWALASVTASEPYHAMAVAAKGFTIVMSIEVLRSTPQMRSGQEQDRALLKPRRQRQAYYRAALLPCAVVTFIQSTQTARIGAQWCVMAGGSKLYCSAASTGRMAGSPACGAADTAAGPDMMLTFCTTLEEADAKEPVGPQRAYAWARASVRMVQPLESVHSKQDVGGSKQRITRELQVKTCTAGRVMMACTLDASAERSSEAAVGVLMHTQC